LGGLLFTLSDGLHAIRQSLPRTAAPSARAVGRIPSPNRTAAATPAQTCAPRPRGRRDHPPRAGLGHAAGYGFVADIDHTAFALFVQMGKRHGFPF